MKDQFYYLSQTEKDSIQGFLNNPLLMEAVKKVLLSGVYYDGILEEGHEADPLRNFILGAMTRPGTELLPNEEMGAKFRAIHNAISLVESGFKQLEDLRTPQTVEKERKNRAR